MSDRTVDGHTLACDWPGCEALAESGGYSSWESYETAVDMFAEQGDCEDWLHTDDGKDYCTKHWHWNDEHGRVPGPEPELMPPWGKSTEEAARSMEAVRQGFASAGHGQMEAS